MGDTRKEIGIVLLEGCRCRCSHEWLPRNKTERPRVCPSCKSANWDKPKKFEWGDSEYREMFETMGIEARKLRHVLRYGGLPRRVYFNRNKDVGIYFSAHGDDEAWYPSNLWEKIGPYRVQKADHKRLNVVPRPGMATGAFRNLVLHWDKHEGQLTTIY